MEPWLGLVGLAFLVLVFWIGPVHSAILSAMAALLVVGVAYWWPLLVLVPVVGYLLYVVPWRD